MSWEKLTAKAVGTTDYVQMTQIKKQYNTKITVARRVYPRPLPTTPVLDYDRGKGSVLRFVFSCELDGSWESGIKMNEQSTNNETIDLSKVEKILEDYKTPEGR